LNSSDLSAPGPVAIIGIGCMFPKAEELARYWANIKKAVDAITEVPESHWQVADYFDPDPKTPDRTYARRGGFLTPVDFPLLDFGIAPNSVEATDTTQLLGLLVAKAALDDAGCCAHDRLDRDRVSVILGVTGTLELVIPLGARLGHPIWRRALHAAGVDGATANDVVDRIASSYVGWHENSFPGLLGNVAAGRIANRLDLRGTNCVVDAACASSLAAINLATLELAAGRCDLAVSGGLDTFNDIFMYMCFSKTPALSPTGDARPFDAGADGTILGEGLGLVVLKRLADARRDGDRIYAVIRSLGTSSDGKGQAVYAPSTAGQVKALKEAYTAAGASPATVELVEAHGTGTKVGDATELAALEEVYRDTRAGSSWCALGSVKSQIGHTKAAAGAAGLIKAALALYHKVLPPTSKAERPIERLTAGDSPFYLNARARPWLPRPDHPRRAAVSAFGFGGSNFHCLLEEAEPEKPESDWDGDVQIMAFSSDRPAEIARALQAIAELNDWNDIRAEGSQGRARFRPGHRFRVLLVAERDEGNLAELAAQARSRLESSAASGSVPRNATAASVGHGGRSGSVFAGVGPAPGALAMLFPGQGSQYVGMLRELACQFRPMLAALALANDLRDGQDGLLSDRIYPQSEFGATARQDHERLLQDTRLAQPAIGAVSLGLLRILEIFGVRPDLTAGHSFGELTALCAAGRIDDHSLAFLAQKRGAIMADCAAAGPRGAMLAVIAPPAEVAALLGQHCLNVVVANKNAPRQCVLAGPAAEVEKSKRLFDGRGIATHPVPVSAAFHTTAVAGAHGPFRSALDSVGLVSSAIPVFSNVTAEPYPAEPDMARALLAEQLARPVEFVSQVEAMYRRGARVFLEVGPDARLTRLVQAILNGRDHLALAVDASRGTSCNLYDLACSLATLAAAGYAVDLTRWDEGLHPSAATRKKSGLTVKVCGANARPSAPSSDQTTGGDDPERVAPPGPAGRGPAAPPSRLSLAIQSTASAVSQPLPPYETEIDVTMDTHKRINSHRTNGQVSSHVLPLGDGPNRPVPDARAGSQRQADPTHAAALAAALENAQQHLLALERLAEQTAALHKQFLEGQEKTQQIFHELLDHEQRLSLALLDSTRSSVRGFERPAGAQFAADVTTQRPVAPANSRPHALEPTTEDNGAARLAIIERPSEFAESIAPPGPEPPSAAARPLAAILLEVVAEKTGYPAEVLDLDMQLDADLGIDSIKRVEILSALQDRLPGLPAIGPERLGSFRTLRAIIDFLGQDRDGHEQPNSRPEAGASNAHGVTSGATARLLVDVVAEKTGYPAEMLELDMRLDTDLGVDSIKRVEIFSAIQDRLPGCPPAGPEQIGTLGTLREIVAFLDGIGHETPAQQAEPAELALPEAPAKRTLRLLHPTVHSLDPRGQREPLPLSPAGTVWVAADGSALSESVCAVLNERGFVSRMILLDQARAPQEPLSGLIILAPCDPAETFVKHAFRILRAVGPPLRRAAARGGASLATVARLDGSFGLRGLDPVVRWAAGALAGMAKTAGREWPEVNCKALDLDSAFESPADAAGLIVDELLTRGPAEVGLSRRGRAVVELEPLPGRAVIERQSVPLQRGELVIVSGGARGIMAEVACALAKSFGPRLLLLGRTPTPEALPGWLAEVREEAQVRRVLLERSNRRSALADVGAEARRLMHAREIALNLARIEAAGSPVIYRSVDVRDGQAVRSAVAEIQGRFGPVRGLIHGAGVLADRTIADQTDAQFDLVYDTKVSGAEHLLRAIDPELLSFLFFFSSSTARFGRQGQVAYAAANEALNKFAQQQSRRLPQCRIVAYNWGPWAGGMVTDSLKANFDKEGLSLIPLDAGAKLVVDEIQSSRPGPVEIVVLAEREPANQADLSRGADKATPHAAGPKLEEAFRRTVSLESVPVLASHVIDGRAVLPLALIMEWLAEGAVHRNPGLTVCGIDDVHLYKGVILGEGHEATVEIRLGKAARSGNQFLVPAELRGTLASGREVAHARATVMLADRYEPSARQLAEPPLGPYPRSPEEIYRTVLFHGPALQGIERVDGLGENAVAGWVATALEPSEWLDQPNRSNWLTDPLAIDCAFQLVVLWCREHLGSNSLPTAVGRYRQFARALPPEGVRVVAEIREANHARVMADIELSDTEGNVVARLGSYECVVDASLNQAFRRNALAAELAPSRAD
jgi:acyl transferase domain-containing protein/NAD(P)-dependent dehydrogenase (short-subunit alcohol dehydrogenase family)